MTEPRTEKAQTYRATLGAILSITTGKLLAPLDEFYGLQDFMVGRPLMTHERTTGWDRQTEALLRQFPRLAEVTVPPFTADASGSKEASVRAWVASVGDYLGWTEADVRRVPGCEVDPGEAFDRVLLGMTTPPGRTD